MFISSIKLSLVYSPAAEVMYLWRLFTHLLRSSWSWESQESLCLAILSTKLLSVCSFAAEVLQAASTVCEKTTLFLQSSQ